MEWGLLSRLRRMLRLRRLSRLPESLTRYLCRDGKDARERASAHLFMARTLLSVLAWKAFLPWSTQSAAFLRAIFIFWGEERGLVAVAPPGKLTAAAAAAREDGEEGEEGRTAALPSEMPGSSILAAA